MSSVNDVANEPLSISLGRTLGTESLAARLQALEDLDVLGNRQEVEFDELVQLAATICDTPVSLISLIGEDKQWFKAAYGTSLTCTSLEDSVCFHAIQQTAMFIVEDLSQDSRFRNYALVRGDEHLRFYGGFPLLDPSGQAVGTLCVLDTKPRRLRPNQLAALTILGKQVQARLELKARQRVLQNAVFANEALVSALAGSNDHLNLVLDAIPTIIIGLTKTGEVSYWNLAAERTFRLCLAQVSGRTLYECGISWLGDRIAINSLYKGEPDNRASDHRFELGGTKRWLGITTCSVEHLSTNDLTNVLLSCADITEKRALEEERRQAQQMEAIGQLAAGIAHEINTPTQYVGDNIDFVRTSIKAVLIALNTSVQLREDYERRCGSTEILCRFDQVTGSLDLDFLMAEIPTALDDALDGTRRIAHIVRAMKEVSHPGTEEKTSLDLNHAIQTAVVITRGEWKQLAQLHLELDQSLPHLVCYAAEVSQVLLNLLINAAHAIQERIVIDPAAAVAGHLRIRTRQLASSIEVCIQDNGMGIPISIQSRVFELFFTTKEVGNGTGQGLAFAHAVIVKKHGGQLWFDSEEGTGTSFYFRLPLVQEQSETSGANSSALLDSENV